ncbi:MAG: hypothetical protein ACE5Q6_16885 [Dehalococcoidia bacterium]
MAYRDALAGRTEADNFRHAIVRNAFFWAFWDDEKVQALVSHWAKNTGLEACALRLASAADRLADLMGLESRGELVNWDDLPDQVTIEEDQVQEAEEIVAEANAAFEAFTHKLSNLDHAADVWPEAVDFVMDLGLPYPWLAVELIECSLHAITAAALGLTFRLNSWYEPNSPSEISAPATSMSFQTRAGESVEEALNRLLLEVHGVMHNLAEAVPPRGRVPDRTIDALEKYARWFYRNRVKGESIRSIAISDFGDADRRKDVTDGIRRAEKLLDLTQYTFKTT